ncbi:Phosphoglycerate kinase [Candidatus Syntrophocurvum alkaliphilum]|uniref:Phosphoglycerate kinase n=1 Tax=Candidatus Syntrophocurvum alkaliphilum TaxID=2293317 RepID=A0A6I6DE13_9FIRM|nr:phosphoglycerate kinase [Candidatus Syntrophocurvum alkaliphilum]QGU00356.1 Phosphoglycerate kinase [Candidatus Syntrophocurvum alkaliphilum]
MRSIRDIDLSGKRVLMRVDFNVPMDKDGEILDDNRIQSAIPTIEYLVKQNAKVILMSHLGRPKGRESKYSLKPVAQYLSRLINGPVIIADDCIGSEVEEKAQELKPGEVLMLENVRYHEEEEKNNPDFSKKLALLGDIFVNDAFGTAHRAHSSTAGVADYLPSYAGLLVENEVKMLKGVIEHPESPRMAILGGSKVYDKLGLINNLLDKMDVIVIGGGMANTFLKAKGINVGKSILEKDRIDEATELLKEAEKKDTRILLPLDVVIADEVSEKAQGQVVDVLEVPDDKMILDIGPKTIEEYSKEILKARTIIWNGPLGVYEYDQFAKGTEEVAKKLADSPAVSVIGGGDSAAAVHHLGLEKNITHISTGGGATLEFLEGKLLPGVAVCGV